MYQEEELIATLKNQVYAGNHAANIREETINPRNIVTSFLQIVRIAKRSSGKMLITQFSLIADQRCHSLVKT